MPASDPARLQPSVLLPPRMPAFVSRVPKVPARADTVANRAPPLRVMILTTPVTASLPWVTLAGPRMISTRSTPSSVKVAKSNDPPASFTGTPSTSTLT